MAIRKYGSATEHRRYMESLDSGSRRRCHCGCKKRAVFRGVANGVALTTGCDLYVRRWVRDGVRVRRIADITLTLRSE